MKHPVPLFDIQAELGEGPVWDPVLQQLYWVDIMAGKYFKADYPSGILETHVVGQPLGALALREKGGLVMALKGGFGLFDETSGKLKLIKNVPEKDNPKVRFNDGAVDPKGRFFAGTMDMNEHRDIGKLYRLDANFSTTLLVENIYISNGMGWSLDHTKFFYIDTLAHCVFSYDYDLETGAISNKNYFIEFGFNEYPDGMAMDNEGGFWIAFWGSSKIEHYDAKGLFVKRVTMPVPQPTSCCFGGADMKTLFITSAYRGLTAVQRKEFPLSGRLFAVETDVAGKIEPKFAG